MTIFIFNLTIIYSIQKFYFQQFQINQKQLYTSTSPIFNILSKTQIHLTIILIIISSIFLILNLPNHKFKFFILINNLLKKQKKNFHLFLIQHYLQIIYYINFTINFLLYYINNKNFQKYIKKSPKYQKY